jgi:hypothetical protein
MSDEHISTPAAHWRRRTKTNPIPPAQAVRQGDITHLAFEVLGRDQAIAFLNTENALLGGRPIALATESAAGHLHVKAELARMHERQA